jgi:hypothetical protein
VVVSFAPEHEGRVVEACRLSGVTYAVVGTVGGDALDLNRPGERWTLDELRRAHGALGALFP